ncbi:unnamed protein product [Lampetra planeri]
MIERPSTDGAAHHPFPLGQSRDRGGPRPAAPRSGASRRDNDGGARHSTTERHRLHPVEEEEAPALTRHSHHTGASPRFRPGGRRAAAATRWRRESTAAARRRRTLALTLITAPLQTQTKAGAAVTPTQSAKAGETRERSVRAWRLQHTHGGE